MTVMKIKCPQCKAGFTLKAPSLNVLASKQFRCNKCGYTSSFSTIIPNLKSSPGVPLHTHIGMGNPQNLSNGYANKTRLATPSAAIIQLVVEETGRSFPVGPGNYTLGRDSADSMATLKISPDRYMSRVHAMLEVGNSASGQSPVIRLKAIAELNPVYINNIKLEPGKTVELRNGDRLLFGMTHVLVRTA